MLNQGDILYLYNTHDHSKAKKEYKSEIIKCENDIITVTYPIDTTTNKMEFVFAGTSFIGKFTKNNGQMYEFTTTVLGRTTEGNPMLLLSNPGETEFNETQRRRFLRIEVSLDVAIHSNYNQFKPFTTQTIDISAGGIAVELPVANLLREEMEVTSFIVLPMLSGDLEYLKQTCIVNRVDYDNNEKKPLASLQFVNSSEMDQQLLTKYCFEKQLAERKKL